MQKIATAFFFIFLFLRAAAQEPPYSVCTGCWNADSLGNQRVLVRYRGNGDGHVAHGVGGAGVARVVIPWRRRDEDAERKRIIVQDSATGVRVRNVWVRSVTREAGDISFEPVSGKGCYYIYYLPERGAEQLSQGGVLAARHDGGSGLDGCGVDSYRGQFSCDGFSVDRFVQCDLSDGGGGDSEGSGGVEGEI